MASDEYLRRRGALAGPTDLSGHDCIIDTNFREPLVWRFRTPGDEPLAVNISGRLRYSNAEACMSAAEKGLGIAYVPSFVAGNSIRNGKVRPLLTDFEDEPFGVYALYPMADTSLRKCASSSIFWLNAIGVVRTGNAVGRES